MSKKNSNGSSWSEMSYNRDYDPWDFSGDDDMSVSTGMEIYFVSSIYGDGEDVIFQDEESFSGSIIQLPIL